VQIENSEKDPFPIELGLGRHESSARATTLLLRTGSLMINGKALGDH
jgi:hypothetical protein